MERASTIDPHKDLSYWLCICVTGSILYAIYRMRNRSPLSAGTLGSTAGIFQAGSPAGPLPGFCSRKAGSISIFH